MVTGFGKGAGMTYDDLLCAACSGRVVDGGCSTCRVSRNRLPAMAQLPAQALFALALLLGVAAMIIGRRRTPAWA